MIELFKKGKSGGEIAKLLRIARSTVFNIIKRYKESGTAADRPRSGRPATAMTPENVNNLRCRIRRNPGKSMRKLAKELKINRESVRKMVRSSLKLRSYKLGKGHYLDERMKLLRLENSKRLLKMKSFRLILFTDEKLFTIQRAYNSQNDRELRRSRQGIDQKFPLFHSNCFISECPSIQRRHFPKSVMVWAGISQNGKTPLVFVDRGVKINAEVYQKRILEDVVMP